MANARRQRTSLSHADMEIYSQKMAETNDRQLEELRRNLKIALQEDISPRQREMLHLYYEKKLKMKEIASLLHCSPSTVSRTIKRGKRNLYRFLKYCI